MVVINPQAWMSREQLRERMAEFVSTIKSTPVGAEGSEILLPGELEFRSEQQRGREGIPLPPAVYEQLARIGLETRMLGGARITQTTRKHAEEMLGHGAQAAAAKGEKNRAAGRAR